MHRELILRENGVTVAVYYSDHNDHQEDMLQKDMMAFMEKIKEKQNGNNKWDWKAELNKAFKESFPYLGGT